MSQFDHESEDQSEACNQLIRDFKLDQLPRPTAQDAAMLAQLAERFEFEKRRDAYRKPDAKRHLEDELYRGISGVLKHYQAYHSDPRQGRSGPYDYAPYYVPDPLEHAIRSLHAMVLQEVDLYLEEHDAAIRHDIQAVREKMREQKDSIGE